MADILRKQNRMISGFADTGKIDTDAGTFEDAEHNTYTGITTDMISYDATNNQLLLKVGGADSVIPFKRGGVVLEDIDPERTSSFLALYVPGQSDSAKYGTGYGSCAVNGYKQISLKYTGSAYGSGYVKYSFYDANNTELANGTISTTWSNWINIPDNALFVKLQGTTSRNNGDVAIYAALLA